jgi:hypothetical protein
MDTGIKPGFVSGRMRKASLSLWVAALGLGAMVAATPPSLVSLSPAVSSGASQTLTATFNAPGGYQTLDVLNVLINTSLDGRQACYLAYSRSANALYIVADSGDASQISGKVMDGTGTVSNSQCSVALVSSSASGSGNTFTLVLSLTFSASFAGNKVIYAAARDLSQNNSGWQTMGVHNVPGGLITYPNPVGMSPPSGNTQTPTLTFSYQDQTSATNLQTVWALINTALDGRVACYVAYYRPGNQLYLYPDNGDGTQATNIVITGSNTISNSQCSISAQGASVQTSGNTLTVTLPVTFTTAFAGFKAVWMAAQTMGGAQTSPWQALGAWSVPAQVSQGTPVISSTVPTTTTSGGALSLQLSLLNIGTAAAAGVQLTSATLGTLSPISPVLPLVVGTVAAGGSAAVNLGFSTASLTVGTNYVLTLKGTYQSGGSAQPFSLYRLVTYGAPGIFQAPPNPVNVTPTLDSAHAVTQFVTAASGGTITTTGGDGSVFTLVFPANAMLSDKAITMTPISSLAGTPSSSTFVAGVQLAPDGLALMAPATLTVQPIKNIPTIQQGGFSYSSSGQDFHPFPLQPVTAVTLQVLHFSGYGAAQTSGASQQVPAVSEFRLEMQLANDFSQLRQNGPSDALAADIAAVLQEFYDQVLVPEVYAAGSDPTKLDTAEFDLETWLEYVRIGGTLGLDLTAFLTEADSLTVTLSLAIQMHYDRYFDACINGGIYGGLSRRFELALRMARLNALLYSLSTWNGKTISSMPNFKAEFAACEIGSLVLDVDMEAAGRTTYPSGKEYVFDLTVPAHGFPLLLDKAILQSNGAVVFDTKVPLPIHYSQPMNVTVVGIDCGSAWQWSEETKSPYAPPTLGAAAMLDLDRSVVQTTSNSVVSSYVFNLGLDPNIFEHGVPASRDGMGNCQLDPGDAATSAFFFTIATVALGSPPAPFPVNLDAAPIPLPLPATSGDLNIAGTFTVKASLTESSQ